MVNQIFVNLPVKDLKRSVAFFTKLGFSFNPQFTDENATCMIIGENMYAMLLVEKFFKTFTPKEIANARVNTESIVSLALGDRDEVDSLVNCALDAGAKLANPPMEMDGMYGLSFFDLDDHLWEVFYMDLSKIQPV
ncbi:MAG: VOC family protein [Anaerolineaceae bacterium]